ncbi:MAG: amidohydrolase family protein [Candidatus Binataceae bacterium]
MSQGFDTVIKGGRVIDPAQSINEITDVAVRDGRIAAIGRELDTTGAEVVNASGSIVSPGLVDIHVHVYGILGFAWPDRVGIAQGVTTYVEPGGPGVASYGEYKALIQGTTVSNLYCGTYIAPLGITALEIVDGDIRALVDLPINQWADLVRDNRDTIRYFKVGAFSNYGSGVVKMAKGLAEILELPLYIHIGDFMKTYRPNTTPAAFNTASAGDMITHIYQNNPGHILDENGRVIPEVKDAERRGVLFDIGFGSFNFSYEIAEQAIPQGVWPHIISSDLQQVNVTGPTYSLANVMSIMLNLGLSPEQVIERVTINPARALSFADRHGTLHPGRAADITLLKIEEGDFEFADTRGVKRRGDRRITPTLAFKDGRRFEVDLELAQEVENWSMQIATDAPPAAVARLTHPQREFLGELRRELDGVQWESNEFNTCFINMETALEIHRRVHAAQSAVGLPLGEALRGLFACFFEQPFTYQSGTLIVRQPRGFILNRLEAVANGPSQAAA